MAKLSKATLGRDEIGYAIFHFEENVYLRSAASIALPTVSYFLVPYIWLTSSLAICGSHSIA